MSASTCTNQLCIHHSRQLRYRQPLGACPAGERLTLRIELKGALRQATPLLYVDFRAIEHCILMHPVEESQEGTLYEGGMDLPQGLYGLLYYRFIINDGQRLFYYGGDTGQGELGLSESTRSYQVTVYDPAYRTPRWPKHCVMYHIFVDRFARGAGQGGLERADYHRQLGRHVYAHENWQEQPLYQPHDGAEHYLPDDCFGGDLAGIRQKLPYLKALGIGGIYLSPIFESYSNHKYDTSDYLKIDPMFGDEEEFRALCAEARRLGMRVMLDGVFSHTGSDSLYFNREGRYGPNTGAFRNPHSPYCSWYTFFEYPGNYDCWWGFETMPNVDESNPEYQQFITGVGGVVEHWLRAGASAWRLDVADELPDAFITLLRAACKRAGEENMLLGEVWEDASNKFSHGEQRQYVMGQELDSVMNYPLRDAIMGFLLQKIDSYETAERIDRLREHYPVPFFYCCLNLISSHDVPRALSILGGGPDKDSGLTREQQAGFALAPEARQTGLARLRLAMMMQMSLPGCPCVYYGDEAGMEGLMDPFSRGAYPWGREDQALLADVSRLIAWRNQHDALQTGSLCLYAPLPDVLLILRFITGGQDVFGEKAEDGVLIAVINRGEQAHELSVDLDLRMDGSHAHAWQGGDGEYEDALSKRRYLCQQGVLTLSLPPCSGLLLERIG